MPDRVLGRILEGFWSTGLEKQLCSQSSVYYYFCGTLEDKIAESATDSVGLGSFSRKLLESLEYSWSICVMFCANLWCLVGQS